MKVLHITASMNPVSGGVCQAIRSMIKGLQGLGIENEVLCLDPSNAPYLENDFFQVHAIGPSLGPWAYSSTLKSWFLKNLSNYKIIILHGLWLYPNFAIQKVMGSRENLNIKPQRIYVMPHGMLDPYFQTSPTRRLKSIRNWLYWKLIESNLINNVDGILFTCLQELKLARTPFKPYHPKKELVIGLGVNEPPAFDTRMMNTFHQICPEVKGHPYFLFLGRIHEKKGVELLVQAYAELQEKYLDRDLPFLIIAGPGIDTSYGARVKKLSEKGGKIQGSVFFPGMLSGDAKWGAFYGCEAFVLPSHQENFGISVVEAMACRKAVLISDQVNIWKEIRIFSAGIIDEDNMNGCFRMLESWILLTADEKKIINSNARNCYRENFSIHTNALKVKDEIL